MQRGVSYIRLVDVMNAKMYQSACSVLPLLARQVLHLLSKRLQLSHIYRQGLLHALVIMLLIVLHEEVSRQRLSHVGMQIHKPANDRVGNSDNAEQIPEINTAHPNASKHVSRKSDDRHKENMCCQSVVLQRVIVSDELAVLVADLGALSGGVAVRDA